MTPEQLAALIPDSESDMLELKAKTPDPRSLARLLASFANSGGGVVLLGVHELQDQRVVGVDAKHVETTLDAALGMLDPQPEVRATTLHTFGKEVVALEVAAAPLTLAPDGLFVRRGATTIPATQEQAKTQAVKVGAGASTVQELARMAGAIAELTATVDGQRAELRSLHKAGA